MTQLTNFSINNETYENIAKKLKIQKFNAKEMVGTSRVKNPAIVRKIKKLIKSGKYVPVPIVCYVNKLNELCLVDGLQRLIAMSAILNEAISYKDLETASKIRNMPVPYIVVDRELDITDFISINSTSCVKNSVKSISNTKLDFEISLLRKMNHDKTSRFFGTLDVDYMSINSKNLLQNKKFMSLCAELKKTKSVDEAFEEINKTGETFE